MAMSIVCRWPALKIIAPKKPITTITFFFLGQTNVLVKKLTSQAFCMEAFAYP